MVGLASTQNKLPNLYEIDDEDKDCPICFDGMLNDDIICCYQCRKFLHESCMTKWLKKNENCPLCRGKWENEQKDDGSDSNDGPL